MAGSEIGGRTSAPAIYHRLFLWEYYADNHVWHKDLEVNVEGVKTIIRIYSDENQVKGPLPNPAKYVDRSYIRDALRDLGGS